MIRGALCRCKTDILLVLEMLLKEEEVMDKDRVAGSAKEIKGTIKQAVGKAVGDTKLEAEGNADKIEGKVQNAIGGIKDTIRGTLKEKSVVAVTFRLRTRHAWSSRR